MAAQVARLSQEKADLSSKLNTISKERSDLKELLLISKQPAEFKAIQERYQHEINSLEKKVCCFNTRINLFVEIVI